jgi:hypothetical protein
MSREETDVKKSTDFDVEEAGLWSSDQPWQSYWDIQYKEGIYTPIIKYIGSKLYNLLMYSG